MKRIFTFNILLFLSILFSAEKSFSQISLITYGSAMRLLKTDTKSGRPSHFGLGLGISADFKDKNRITVSSVLHAPVFWTEEDRLKAYDPDLCKLAPNLAVCEERMKTFEVSALYSYYIAGRCNSFADVYASVGGGAIFYDGILNFKEPPHFTLKESRANLMLDTRLGAEMWITIGYMFVEAKFAPMLFEVKSVEGHHHDISSYIGGNIGFRFMVTQPFSKSSKPTILDQ